MYHLKAATELQEYIINENQAARSLRGINQLCDLKLIQPPTLGESLQKLMQKNLEECRSTRSYYESYYMPYLGETYIKNLRTEIYNDNEGKLESINFFLEYIENSEIRIVDKSKIIESTT